jgi:hypothetical protein
MGIIIGDTLTLHNGLTVSNTYGSLHNSSIQIEKSNRHHDLSEEEESSDKITINAHGSIWVNKTYREKLSSPTVSSHRIIIQTTIGELKSTDIYTILYDEWKKTYEMVSDDI